MYRILQTATEKKFQFYVKLTCTPHPAIADVCSRLQKEKIMKTEQLSRKEIEIRLEADVEGGWLMIDWLDRSAILDSIEAMLAEATAANPPQLAE